MANLAPRPAWQRGLAALLVFVLTFIVTMVVGIAIVLTILGNLGYDTIFQGSNPAPDWLDVPLFWGTIGTALVLASFLGWKFWRHRR